MTNPFSTDNLINGHFFPLTKGGAGSGRYPKGSGRHASAKEEASDRAHALQDNVAENGTYQGAADEHRAIAAIHQKLANEFRASMPAIERLTGDRSPSDFDQRAVAAHLEAADAHDKAMELLAKDPDLEDDETQDAVNEAQNATDYATLMTANTETPITVWHND